MEELSKTKQHSCSAWENNTNNPFHTGHNLLGNTLERSKVLPCRQKFPEKFPAAETGFGYPETKHAPTAEYCLEIRDRKDPIQLKASIASSRHLGLNSVSPTP